MILPKLSRRFYTFIKVLALIWGVELVLRGAFALWQLKNFPPSKLVDILTAFYIGIRFDGRIAAVIALALIVYIVCPSGQKVYRVFYTFIATLLLLTYIGDFAYYAYMSTRINFSLFSELNDLQEALGVVWSSYPVIPLVVLLIIAALLFYCIFGSIFRGKIEGASRKDTIFSLSAALLFSALLIYGQYTPNAFPLRWSEAYFSGKPLLTALALNPIQNIYDTKPKTKINAYDITLVEESYPLTADFLKIPESENLRLDRFVEGDNLEKPNVVLILMESLSTHKSSFMFEELATTPFLKELAAASLYFPNYYASARTTARAVYSVITGIPDGNTFFASSPRDAMAIDQFTIWNQFDGYKKYFMMGGNANWANIRGVLANNISGINILEAGYWKSPKIDVWGISDLDLFREAHNLLENEESPFFAIILTASFHRPFTVPKGLADFDYTIPDGEYLERYGFVSDEYLSMRFCDYAVREFFRLAMASKYYDNTIFIVTGDHGISERSPSAPKNYQLMSLHEYQVPLIIHYPKKIPQGEVQLSAGGHIDLFPTIASLAGVGYRNTTLGRDLLDKTFGDDRWAFIMRSFLQPVIISKDRCFAAQIKGEGRFYRRDADNISQDWQEDNISAEELESYQSLTTGLREMSRYLLYHNKKGDIPH
ncbi:MAG: sulfatase-like hydrolase/transferase [Deferribacteraceae bacterium]|jgi:phosphoglycerol transferase MdoB-like AlkP superfamily enzyme|nr:sulfatase-like hydrolase/transferase [Deferribacteraceae bacterium]